MVPSSLLVCSELRFLVKCAACTENPNFCSSSCQFEGDDTASVQSFSNGPASVVLLSSNKERVRSAAQSSSETKSCSSSSTSSAGFSLGRPQRPATRTSEEDEPHRLGWRSGTDPQQLFGFELNIYSCVQLKTTCAYWTASPWTSRRWTSSQQSACPVSCGKVAVTPPTVQTSSFHLILSVAQETIC